MIQIGTSLARKKFEKRWFPLRYHRKQQQLFRSPTRFIGVPAGRRSGKTELAKRKLVMSLKELKPWGDPRYFYGAPTEGQAKRLAWKDLISMIPQSWIYGEPHHSELMIETKFGSTLHVVGLDKPQRIEGDAWDGCVIDESCDIKPKTFDLSVAPALADRLGWCWRIGVPKRHGVGAQEFKSFCEKADKDDDPDEACFSWPSSEIQPAEVLRWYQERMDARDYAEQFEATWQRAAGQVFFAYDPDFNDRACSFDPHKPLFVTCDFNVDPMAWILFQETDEIVEVFDEIWARDTNTQATLDVLWNKYGEKMRSSIHFYGDATGKGRHTSASMSDYVQIATDKRFKSKGATVHFPKANPNRSDRFAATNAMFCNAAGRRRMFIDPRVEHLRIDLEMRGFKAGTNEPDDKGDVGHPTDALGYAIFMRYPIEGKPDGESRVVIRTPGNGKGGNGRNGNGKKNGNGRKRVGRRIPHARRTR